MDSTMIDEHLENIDRRLTRVEQILPTLATKADLQSGIAPLATEEELQAAVALLATEEELQAAVALLATKEELQAAVALLATREELRAAIAPLATREELREEGERSRRHMDVIAESLRSDIQLIAEHVASARPKHGGPS